MPQTISVNFPQGTCPVQVFADPAVTVMPTVLFFVDVFGPRPATSAIAERLASEGYRVLMPDPFYARRPYTPLSPASVFSGGEDRQRLGAFLAMLGQDSIDADVGALLSFCEGEYGVAAPRAATGYCMGGRYALTAAALAPELSFAASFHGSNLAPADGEGVHRRLRNSAARIYIGIAEHDPTFAADEEGRLAEALRADAVDHMIESYRGAAHGFVMPDLPVYHPVSADRHWRRLRDGLREAFAA